VGKREQKGGGKDWLRRKINQEMELARPGLGEGSWARSEAKKFLGQDRGLIRFVTRIPQIALRLGT